MAKIPSLRAALDRLKAERLQSLHSSVDELGDLRQKIDHTIVPEPPISLSDGGVIQSGIHQELDELRDLSRNSKQYLAQIEQRERQRTGISSLKIKFNSVFGYYIEVSKPNLHLVPADYERKQTLVNAERFTTPELKEYESKILDAQEKIVEIERRLFARIALCHRRRSQAYSPNCSRYRRSRRPGRTGSRRGAAQLLPPQVRRLRRSRNRRRTPSRD